jgi:hypothetical protein
MQGAQAQARGAELIGQGLAGLGQQVASGIEKYYKKEEQKQVEQQGVEFIKSNVPGIDDKAARAGLKAAGGAAAFVNFMASQRQSQEATREKQQVDSLTEILRQGGGTIPSPISNEVARSFSPSTLNAARKQFLEQSKMEAEINKLNFQSIGKPVEGEIMTPAQVREQESLGLSITGVPVGQNIRVTSVKTLPKPTPTIGSVAPGTVVTPTPGGGFISRPIEGAPPTESETQRTILAETKQKAQQNFGNQVKSAFGSIMALNELGALVKPENDILTNLKARVSSSTVGQLALGATGTEVASLQAQLKQLQPLMIASIKEATGLSATQLNSNVELRFYMDSMADPQKDFYSNLAALDALSKQIGAEDIVGQLLADKPDVLAKIRRDSNTLQIKKPIKLDLTQPESTGQTTAPTAPKIRAYNPSTGKIE